MNYSRYGWEEQLTRSLVGLALLVLIVLLILALWVSVRVMNLLVSVTVRHADNRFLRVAWTMFGLALLLLLLTGGRVALFNALMGVSGMSLVLTAKAIQTFYDELLKRENNREAFVHDVLHEWWPAA